MIKTNLYKTWINRTSKEGINFDLGTNWVRLYWVQIGTLYTAVVLPFLHLALEMRYGASHRGFKSHPLRC